MKNPPPKVPDMLNTFAREALEEMSGNQEVETVVIGGGVALQHYLAFRPTTDLDAWWTSDSCDQKKEAATKVIQQTMTKLAASHAMTLETRSFGETVSYELKEGNSKRFSLQISSRGVELEKPQMSIWAPVKIETFAENIGSKMNALVSRGAPRDFVDIYTVCQHGLLTPRECWQNWGARNPGVATVEASAKVMAHLKDLEARRPLDQIPNAHERVRAAIARTWFRTDFTQEIRHDIGY